MLPKLSIITVNYNNASGLKRTIESVIDQEINDIEHIVIDGNSTDASLEVIKENENHINKWISEPDTGVYQAMNKGIRASTGDYLLFLNSGDHFYQNQNLDLAIDHLTGEDLICFDIAVQGQGKNYIKQHPQEISLSYMLLDTLAHQAICIKRSLFDTIGNYDESLKIVADWKFFLDVLLRPNSSYKAVHITLTKYYLDGMSATGKGTFKRRAERKDILEGPYKFLLEAKNEALLIRSNRFKILNFLESSGLAKKLNSGWLRLLLFLLKGKRVKDLN